MKSSAFQISVAAATSLLALSGCGGKPNVDAEAAKVEKAFPAEAQAAPRPAPSALAPDNAAPAPEPQADVNASVKAALSAVHSKDYGEGVIAVQTVQKMPGVSANQLMALERAKQAMMANLQERADQGDAKAIAELKRIEKTLSQ